jgi:hypothetical protein
MVNNRYIVENHVELMESDDGRMNSLNELEELMGRMTRRISREILGQWLDACEEVESQPRTKCRDCGKDANYVSKRVGVAHTQYGVIRYRRAYYVCPHCHQSTCPLDERLNPIESLARMRAKIATGKSLPVAEMASAWGLGSLNRIDKVPATVGQNPLRDNQSSSGELKSVFPVDAQIGFLSIF